MKVDLKDAEAYPFGVYSKTCLKRLLSRRPEVSFQDRLSQNAGQNIEECSLCNTFDLH